MDIVCNFIEKAVKAFDRTIYKQITRGVTYFYEKTKYYVLLFAMSCLIIGLILKFMGITWKWKKPTAMGFGKKFSNLIIPQKENLMNGR